MEKCKRAIVFVAWGEKYTKEVTECVKNSCLPEYDMILITDHVTQIQDDCFIVLRVNFQLEGLVRKAELLKFLPEGYTSFLLLDADTRVIEDIELGFEKAELHGIAMSPAPHYSLDWFWGFDKVMESEGLPIRGQLQYNTGVIFFALTSETRKVLEKWHELCEKHHSTLNNDQPYLTLAMELCDFNPFTLSIGYNYRGFGDAVSGIVRIWHSYTPMPQDINTFKVAWPPRKVVDGEVIHVKEEYGE